MQVRLLAGAVSTLRVMQVVVFATAAASDRSDGDLRVAVNVGKDVTSLFMNQVATSPTPPIIKLNSDAPASNSPFTRCRVAKLAALETFFITS